MRTLLIDNYDSFTWNLFDLIGRATGREPDVIRNDTPDDKVSLRQFDNIVISPGPGHPANARDFGVCATVLRNSSVPVLGVCLGHQGLCHVRGGIVTHAPRPCHGEVHEIFHNEAGLFDRIPSPFSAVRYHSLIVSEVPEDLEVIARTADGLVMAVRSRNRPQWGVQFHPESICSEFGLQLIQNFVAGSTSRELSRSFVARRKKRYRIHTRHFTSSVEPLRVFECLYASSASAIWLDTSRPSKEHRFSFLGDASGPLSEQLSYSMLHKRLTIKSNTGTSTLEDMEFFDYLNSTLKSRRTASPPDLPFEFNLGYVGYIGYEMKAAAEGTLAHPSPFPDVQLLFVDRLIAYDHERSEYWLLCLTEGEDADGSSEWIATIERSIQALSTEPSRLPVRKPSSSILANDRITMRHGRDSYLRKIHACLDKIRDGESYEVCLTNMLSADCTDDPLAVYTNLRSKSPAPYGAFLTFGDMAILCSSPERFLSVSAGGTAESKPIKGTRPVHSDPATNQHAIDDLRSSKKDRAENLMIVDLVRNDLSRVCNVGTVHVPKLFEIESFSHVHQLVSTVRGQLDDTKTAVDCILASFPGGSMTGAPKVRTMEIIDELEEGPRGVYSGTIGFLALNGAADLNIVIRTIVIRDGVATFGVGGAIIAMSDADDEFEETLVKARSSLAGLSISTDMLELLRAEAPYGIVGEPT